MEPDHQRALFEQKVTGPGSRPSSSLVSRNMVEEQGGWNFHRHPPHHPQRDSEPVPLLPGAPCPPSVEPKTGARQDPSSDAPTVPPAWSLKTAGVLCSDANSTPKGAFEALDSSHGGYD